MEEQQPKGSRAQQSSALPKPKVKSADLLLALFMTFGLMLLLIVLTGTVVHILTNPISGQSITSQLINAYIRESSSAWQLAFSTYSQAIFNIFLAIGLVGFFNKLGKVGDNPMGTDSAGIVPGIRGAAVLIVPTAIALAGINMASQLFWDFIGFPIQLQGHLLQYIKLLDPPHWPAITGMVLAAVIAAPLFEEVVFRGILFKLLRKKLSLAAAVIISGILFGLIHFNLAAGIPLAAFGAFLAILYHRTNNLWYCIFLHAFFNASSLSIIVILQLINNANK